MSTNFSITLQPLTAYVEDLETRNLTICACASLPVRLVASGMFPTSPTLPRMAVAISLLEFYHTLFERSAVAVNATAAALHTLYVQRGWDVVDAQVRYLCS